MMQREHGYILGFCYLVVSVAACCAADREDGNALTPEEKAAGWTLLFDGKTMHGWDDPRMKSPPGDAWTIEDGCLKANRNPRITEDLFSQDTFTDFELMLEWRISPRGNSGVKYRIQDHWFIAPKESGGPHERFEASVERSLSSSSCWRSGSMALVRLDTINAGATAARDKHVPSARTLGQLRTSVRRCRLAEATLALLAHDEREAPGASAQLQSAAATVDKARADCEPFITRGTASERYLHDFAVLLSGPPTRRPPPGQTQLPDHETDAGSYFA